MYNKLHNNLFATSLILQVNIMIEILLSLSYYTLNFVKMLRQLNLANLNNL